MFRAVVAALAVVAFVLALPAAAEAAPVVSNTNNSGPGSLRQAVIDAASGDTITFAPALAGQTIVLTFPQITINKNLTIVGPPGGLTISGNNSTGIFRVDHGRTVEIADLTLTNGRAQRGGAIYVDAVATLTLRRLTVQLSHAFNPGHAGGGGIYVSPGMTAGEPGGALFVYDSSFGNNSSAGGGAIALSSGLFVDDQGSTATVENSTFADNTGSDWGGAIFLEELGTGNATGGSLHVAGSNFVRNSSDIGGAIAIAYGGFEDAGPGTLFVDSSTFDRNSGGYGGAIAAIGGPNLVAIVSVTDSALINNEAGIGGGVGVLSTRLTMVNSTLSGNAGLGGAIHAQEGIYSVPSQVTVRYSTITNNTAPIGSGALDTTNQVSADPDHPLFLQPGHISLTSTIVAEQAGGGADCAATPGITSSGYNLDSDGTCGLNSSGDISNGNANLAPLALNPPGTTKTHAIGPDSDAYNKIPSGVNGCGATVTTDQRGVSRPQGSACDIGAYEFECAVTCPAAAVGGTVEMAVGTGASGFGATRAAVLALALVAGGAAVGGWRSRWRVRRRG